MAQEVSIVQLMYLKQYLLKLYTEHPFFLNLATCLEAVRKVLKKRDVQYTILTGIALDTLAEQCLLPEPLQTIIYTDESLYGLDEVLAYGITNIYGSIGITSFGYLDKIKPGIIKDLDNNAINKVNTFLDDMVAGIAAAACAKIAHAQTENLVSGNHHENQD